MTENSEHYGTNGFTRINGVNGGNGSSHNVVYIESPDFEVRDGNVRVPVPEHIIVTKPKDGSPYAKISTEYRLESEEFRGLFSQYRKTGFFSAFTNLCRKILTSTKPKPIRELDNKRRSVPPEWRKTLYAFVYFSCVLNLMVFILTIVQNHIPDVKKHPPLPDIILDMIPRTPEAHIVGELAIVVLSIPTLFILPFHIHKSIILRRFFCLTGTVFLVRCITVLLTPLPLSWDGKYLECGDHHYNTLAEKLQRMWQIFSAAGVKSMGAMTCGDYIFSGHTVWLTMLNLSINEYTPKKMFIVRMISWMMNLIGMSTLLISHEHYSIDVFLSFYITSRLFYNYHVYVDNKHNMVGVQRMQFLFPFINYFEANSNGKLENKLQCPEFLQYLFIGIRQAMSRKRYTYSIA